MLTVCDAESNQPKFTDRPTIQNWEDNWQYFSAAEAQIAFLKQLYQTWQAQDLLDVFSSVAEALYRRVKPIRKDVHVYTLMTSSGSVADFAYYVVCDDDSAYWISLEHGGAFQPPTWFHEREKGQSGRVLSVDPGSSQIVCVQ